MPGVPGIQSYTSVAASNTTLFPENMAPSAVNDGMRQVQADIRSWYTDAEWSNWGDTPSRASNTTFKIGADVTSRYTVNRRIKCYDATTIYGVVTASSYSAPDTTVTVKTDSGNLSASLSSVALSIISPTSTSLPTRMGSKGSDVASAGTINLSTAGGEYVDVTGTTTITAITSEAAGTVRRVRFTGALTLTHNATSLILPGAANITTAANDRAEFVSLDGTNWICFQYTTASGNPISGAVAPSNAQFVTLATDTTLTSERVLTAGAGVTLTDAGAGSTVTVATSGWVKIGASQTASSSATIDFTGLTSTYSAYAVVLDQVLPASDGVYLWMRTSTDGGSTYAASSGNYFWSVYSGRAAGNVNAYDAGTATAIRLCGEDSTYLVSNTAGEGVSGIVQVINPSGAVQCKVIAQLCLQGSTTNYALSTSTVGIRIAAADVDSIRFLMSSGNIASGKFTLYGILA